MQKAPTPPTPPAPPALPDFVGTPGTLGLHPGMPLTDEQREAIQVARDRLSDQLISATGRRNDIAEALKTAQGTDRAGLEQRLTQLDQRILQLEGDLAETGRILTSIPILPPEPDFFSSGTMVPPPLGGLSPGNVTALGIVFTLFVLAPMALAAARLMWRRAVAPRPAAPSFESMQRLERVEQAIDAVAVEVERISEGQRFVTRILTEGPAQTALGGGRAEPIGVPRREGARVPREEV
jgi:hypothetical protein